MKNKIQNKKGFFKQGLMLVVMAVFLLPLNGYAEDYYWIDSDDFDQSPLIWDLTGSYSHELLGCELTFDLSQDVKGKLSGNEHVVGIGSLEGHPVEMNCDLSIKGSIKQKNGAASVKITTKISGTADVPDMDIYGAKISGTKKISATINPYSQTLIGTVQEKISIKGFPSIKKTGDFITELPEGMDGSWSLEIVADAGDGSLWLSNGDLLGFSAQGKYNAKSDETKFTLKGTGNASGCKLSPVIHESTGGVTSIKGKVLGQNIIGSGGGSSGSDKLFSLLPSDYYQPGYKETYKVTGSDTGGGKFDGDVFYKTKATVVLESTIVTPVDSLFNLKNTVRDVFISSYVTQYFDENKTPVMMVSNTTGVTYTPVSISLLPDEEEIGGFGPLTTWNGDDGTTMTGNWSLEKNDGSESLADFVSMVTSKDDTGKIIVYQELVRTIDKNGVPKGVTIKWHYPDTGITVNLSLEKIE